MENLQILAGSVSSLIFMLGTWSMLVKAWRTRDMRSYSLAQIGLNNLGNVVHWIYIASLPFGPIWFLHGFFTLSTFFMLVWCILYRHAPELVEKRTTDTLKRITQSMEFRRVQLNDQDVV